MTPDPGVAFSNDKVKGSVGQTVSALAMVLPGAGVVQGQFPVVTEIGPTHKDWPLLPPQFA